MPDTPQPHASAARVVCVIPARLQSQRLPRKMLREIAGRPLLAWTFEAATRCPQFSQIVVATDAEEIGDLCDRNGWPWQMTSLHLASGTDRLAEVARSLPADIYVNLQGDEPLVTSAHIEALLAPFANPHVDVTTLQIRCEPHEIADPNVVKVVTAPDGRALYFSRATIPFDRDGTGTVIPFKHLGLYAYRREALQRFAALPPGHLESIEKLEQLRLLENGLALYVTEVHEPTVGVDTEADLARVAALLTLSSH